VSNAAVGWCDGQQHIMVGTERLGGGRIRMVQSYSTFPTRKLENPYLLNI